MQRRQTDLGKEDPLNILRHVIKGFDIANPEDVYEGQDDTKHLQGAEATPAEIEAWKRPRHPTKPELKLLDSYPIKPDLDAMPDSGNYIITKFSGNPTSVTNQHDVRLDVALINPIEKLNEDYDYEFYVVPEAETVKDVKRKFNLVDHNIDDTSHLEQSSDGDSAYKYHHHRTYELARQINSLEQPYKEVGLALHDPDDPLDTSSNQSRLSKGAYYYPIGMRMNLKPKRNKNLANLGLQQKAVEMEEERPDEINLILREPNEDESNQRKAHGSELMSQEKVTNGVAAAG